jgi:hypothetical protein
MSYSWVFEGDGKISLKGSEEDETHELILYNTVSSYRTWSLAYTLAFLCPVLMEHLEGPT